MRGGIGQGFDGIARCGHDLARAPVNKDGTHGDLLVKGRFTSLFKGLGHI